MSLWLMPAFVTAAALLVLAGARKLHRPRGAADALEAAGLPGSPLLARALGAGEVALGLACLLLPGRAVAAGLALAYGAFALVVLRLRRASATCGCFGAEGPPAGALHAALDVAAALVAAAAAVAGPAALPALVHRPAGEAAATFVAVGAATYAGYLAFTVLPALWDAWLGGEAAT